MDAQTSPAAASPRTSGAQLPGLAVLEEFRVSQLVRDYNMQQARLESRGGGFRRKKSAQPKASGAAEVREAGYKYQQTKEGRLKLARARWPSDQLELLPEEQIALTHGSQFQYFCPKRFNRYPRFTIFFKRDQATGNE